MKTLLFPALALGFALPLAPAGAERAAPADAMVMEIVRFRLVDGADADSFLAAAKGTEAALRRQRGFLRRVLVQDGDGFWTDLVEWADLATAEQAASVVMQDASFAAFGALIDMATIQMSHPAIRWRMD